MALDMIAPKMQSIIRYLRSSNNWTLAQMSRHVGVPVSTLSKIEKGKSALQYDKLVLICKRMELRLSDLLNTVSDSDPKIVARRVVGRLSDALHIEAENRRHDYLCTEMRHKIMSPVLCTIGGAASDDVEIMGRHSGEEFVYVLKGEVEFRSEFYGAIKLRANEYAYFDGKMKHAYVAAKNCSEATLLVVCAGKVPNLQRELVEQARRHTEKGKAADTPRAVSCSRQGS